MIRTLLALSFVAGCSTAKPPAPVSPSDTTVELAARRAQMIGWLHDYGVAGVFPTDDAGQPLSVFRDPRQGAAGCRTIGSRAGDRDDAVGSALPRALQRRPVQHREELTRSSIALVVRVAHFVAGHQPDARPVVQAHR